MLPNFTKSLEKYKSDLKYNTFWRFTKAKRYPNILMWIAERPEVAEALAADARHLAELGAITKGGIKNDEMPAL